LHAFRFGDDCHENSRENHGGHRDNYREKSGLKAISSGWCDLQFGAGSPQHILCTWLLTCLKRKLPARRDVFSLEQQCSEIGTNSKIVVFFTGVQ